MDPYLILGVSTGCSREEVKEAFRAGVLRTHPDRGGDGEAFVRLCGAYRRVLEELERRDGPNGEATVLPPRDRVPPPPLDPDAARKTYVTWLRRVSKTSTRRPPVRWWRKDPRIARAILLGLIALSGGSILGVTLMIDPDSMGRAARRASRTGSRRGGVAVHGSIGDRTSPSPAGIDPPRPSARNWEPPGAGPRDVFVVPYDATLYMTPMGGNGGGVTEFGVGTSQGDHRPIFRGLPSKPVPADEIEVGFVEAGSRLRLYLKTGERWAFSGSGAGREAEEAFRDRDDSLGGGGSIAERTGPMTWVLHLDDVGSGDDDDDVLIGIRLDPVGRP